MEEKRRLSIRDMRDACVGGISHGDAWLKDFIHLYFNSKYAKDYHDVNSVNYSLRQDIRQPNLDLVMKYIDVISVDPSGPVVTNAKHLYGAILIILRDQLTDELASSILYLLKSYCLSFLGVGKNTTLIDEFRTGYWENGLQKLLKVSEDNNPHELKQLIDNYNQAIVKDTKDNTIKQFIKDKEKETVLYIATKSYLGFSDKYLN